MYDTKGLSQNARFRLDTMLYSGIIREMESLRFTIDAIGISANIQNQLATLGELVNWYCNNIMVSGNYLREEFLKLQQFIRIRSGR